MQNVMTPSPASAGLLARRHRLQLAKSNVPVIRHSSTMPISKPTSPSFVVQNAFTAARAADGLRYQKPISR